MFSATVNLHEEEQKEEKRIEREKGKKNEITPSLSWWKDTQPSLELLTKKGIVLEDQKL